MERATTEMAAWICSTDPGPDPGTGAAVGAPGEVVPDEVVTFGT
jgi:hypothetical protein